MIDLHTHSTFSDGSYTPEELVAMSLDAGLSAVALTDHDSVDGVPRLLAACEGTGLTGVSGVEVSADVSKGGMHMLGYFLDHNSDPLEELLHRIRDGRVLRNEGILENLNKAGVELTFEEVAAYAGEGLVGRPHFAQAMLAKGYVSSKDEAFDRYLAKGKPGYADRIRLTPEDCIAHIHEAGGLAAIAHPFTLELGEDALGAFVGKLADSGLDGVEVYYSEHSPKQVEAYRGMAYKYDLLLTGGSDFHGEVNPAIKLGVGFGNLRVNDDLLEKMRERLARRG